jgi:hypothetical protein
VRDKLEVDLLAIHSLVNVTPRRQRDSHMGISIKTKAGTLTFFSSDWTS